VRPVAAINATNDDAGEPKVTAHACPIPAATTAGAAANPRPTSIGATMAVGTTNPEMPCRNDPNAHARISACIPRSAVSTRKRAPSESITPAVWMTL